jgi:hypothetical protein
VPAYGAPPTDQHELPEVPDQPFDHLRFSWKALYLPTVTRLELNHNCEGVASLPLQIECGDIRKVDLLATTILWKVDKLFGSDNQMALIGEVKGSRAIKTPDTSVRFNLVALREQWLRPATHLLFESEKSSVLIVILVSHDRFLLCQVATARVACQGPVFPAYWGRLAR